MNSTLVREFIASHHLADAWLYLLIDPTAATSLDDPLHIGSLRERLGDAALTPVPRPDLSHSESAWPVLVTLASPGGAPPDDLLGMSGRRGQFDDGGHWRYVCGWLSSLACADDLRDHLVALSLLPTGDASAYYPMHEPLRLELTASLFEPGHANPWWPIRRGLVPTSGDDHLLLEGDPGRVMPPTPEMTAMQQDVPLIQSLLAVWRRTLPLALGDAPTRRTDDISVLPPLAALKCRAQIQQARVLGLTDPEDILMLAVHRLVIHQRLHWHTAVRQLIAEAAQKQAPLSALFGLYRDEDWRQVVRDLDRGVTH